MTWTTALTEGSNSQGVINYVKNFVDENNTLAVLQQIPYKYKDENNNYVLHQAYIDFMETFSDDEYKVFQNNTYNKGFIVMMTVIVTKMHNVIKALTQSTSITSRESAVTVNLDNNSIDVYGIHARNGEDNRTYLKSLDNIVEADIILGDFNAGDYEDCQNRATFRSILKDYVCICNMPTKEVRKEFVEAGEKKTKIIRKTCIDHIFVKRNIVTQCSNLIVDEDNKLSDHYPIIVDINL